MIRGNISEIKTLASGAGTTKGVDADVADKVTEENLDSAVAFAKAFAAQTGMRNKFHNFIENLLSFYADFFTHRFYPM